MSTKFKVIVKTGKAENNQVLDVEQGGKALRIKAIAGAKFQLQEIDKDTSLAPEVIKVKRVGKSLHILLAGSNAADVIIEDYYEVMPQGYNGIVGQAENGNYYEYLTQDPSEDGLIWSLTENSEAVAHALGGLEVSGAGAAGGVLAAAFNPLLGVLGLVGAAAAAGGGGGGGTNAANDTNAAAALSAISAAAQNNNATDSNVAASVFATAGVTGVDTNNVAAIQSALNSAAVIGSSADSLPEVQAIVDAYNTIKANADGTANNYATKPTQAQYAALGVTGVDSDVKAKLLGDAIDGKPFSAVDTVAEVQALADAAAAVMTGAAGGTAPTKAQLEALGITGVTDANLAAVQAAIAATGKGGTGVDTRSELQKVATNAANAAAALSSISAAAQANNATDANVATSVFATAGVTGVNANNVAAIQSALNSAAAIGTSADTLPEVQAIVDAYKAILAEANDTANTAGNGTPDANSASNPTAAQYAAIGVNLGSATTDASTDAETLALLNAIVGGKQTADVDTVAEVQALANIANAIQLQATGFMPSPALTVADLTLIGLDTTGVNAANLPTLLTTIAAKNDNGSETDTLEKLQALINNLGEQVKPVNKVPGAQTVTEDVQQALTGLSVSDADGNLSTTQISVLKGKLNVNLSSGTRISAGANDSATLTLSGTAAQINATLTTVKYTGASNYNGADTLTVVSTDSEGVKDTDNMAITVTAVNDSAVISGNITGAVVEAGGVNNATAGTPTATGTLMSTDIDGTPNAFTAVSTATATSGGYGTYVMTAGGAWTYTLNNSNTAVQLLNASETLNDTFKVMAADSTEQLVTVKITGENDAPTLVGSSINVKEGIMVQLVAEFIKGYSDADGDAQAGVKIVALPSASAGILKYNGDPVTVNQFIPIVDINAGKIVFAAKANYVGPASFQISAVDASASNNTTTPVTVNINLTAVNDPAVISGNITGAVVEAGGVNNATAGTATATGTLTSTDVDGIPNAFTAVSSATASTGGYGTYVMTAGGAWTYTLNNSNTAVQRLNASETLNDTFKVMAADGTEKLVTVKITGENDAPTLVGSSINVKEGIMVQLVAEFIKGYSDADGDAQAGVKIVALPSASAGILKYNGNPVTVNQFISIVDINAGKIVFAATANYVGPASFQISAVDASASNNTTTPVTVNINLTTVNAAPVLNTSATPILSSVSASAAAPAGVTGDLVNTLVGGISDADYGALKGIAITGVKAGATLHYSINDGTTWLTATSVSDNNALLLAADANTRVFYRANGTSGTISDAITFRAWDMTANITEGVYTDTTPRGGTAQFSTATDTVAVISTVDPLQTAACAGFLIEYGHIGTNMRTYIENLTSFAGAEIKFYVGSTLYETATLNSNGSYTQPANNLPVNNGSVIHAEVIKNGMTYVIGGGIKVTDVTNWTTSSITYASPLVLDLNGDGVQTTDAVHTVQFDLNHSGTPQQTSWVDKHDGLLTIDLNGDGQINSGAELFGNYTQLANGTTASNGWAALGEKDSNQDGKIDAKDANFDKLRVWVDANGDGVTEAGEMHTLADVKVASIDLHANNTIKYQNGNALQGFSSYTSTDGATHEVADVWFQTTPLSAKTQNNDDGLIDKLAQAAEFQNKAYTLSVEEMAHLGLPVLAASVAVGTTAAESSVYSLSSGQSLELTQVLKEMSANGIVKGLEQIDMATDTAANVVSLSLADVLSLPSTDGVYKLTLIGDPNDTVDLDIANWTNTGKTVTENGYSYSIYNATHFTAAQLLIDQHMLMTQVI